MKVHIDFETRSACDLRKAGAVRYAMDPTTELLCLAYNIDGGEYIYAWHRGGGYPEELLDAVVSGAEVCAHNAMFELAMWTYHCVPKLGWPKRGRKLWRCPRRWMTFVKRCASPSRKAWPVML